MWSESNGSETACLAVARPAEEASSSDTVTTYRQRGGIWKDSWLSFSGSTGWNPLCSLERWALAYVFHSPGKWIPTPGDSLWVSQLLHHLPRLNGLIYFFSLCSCYKKSGISQWTPTCSSSGLLLRAKFRCFFGKTSTIWMIRISSSFLHVAIFTGIIMNAETIRAYPMPLK